MDDLSLIFFKVVLGEIRIMVIAFKVEGVANVGEKTLKLFFTHDRQQVNIF